DPERILPRRPGYGARPERVDARVRKLERQRGRSPIARIADTTIPRRSLQVPRPGGPAAAPDQERIRGTRRLRLQPDPHGRRARRGAARPVAEVVGHQEAAETGSRLAGAESDRVTPGCQLEDERIDAAALDLACAGRVPRPASTIFTELPLRGI